MELIYIFRILYRKKWIIIGSTILAVALAFVFTMKQKKFYKSSAQLSTGYTNVGQLKINEEIFNLPQIDVKFNTAITDILSPRSMSLLTYRLMLHDLNTATPFRKLEPSVLKENPSLKNIDKAEATRILNNKKDSIQLLNPGDAKEKQILALLEAYRYNIAAIKKYLYVGRHQRTDYIDVIFRSENPELSAFVVNELSREFQRYYDAFSRERSIESMISLDSQVRKSKQNLDEKIAAKARYLTDSVSSTIDPGMIGANILGQITQIESSLAVEEGNLQDLNYQLTQVDLQLLTAGGSTTPTTSGDNSLWLALRKQWNDLNREYQNKGSNDPDMKKQLDDLKERMDAAAPTTTGGNEGSSTTSRSVLIDRKNSIEGKLRGARFLIQSYRSKLGELNARLRSASPSSSASLDRFDKEIEVAQLEYTNAREKLTKANNMTDGLAQNFRQTLYGQPALEPEPSKRMVLLGLSGLSAFIISALLFIFLAYIDQSIKTPSQFQRQTDLKLLGTVNMINMKQGSLANQVTLVDAEDPQRDNAFRELLRKLRYEIERTGKRIILFTSTEPRQGKTTLTQALAFSLSLSKKRVLILDTNFCNNDLTVLNSAQETLEQFSGNGQLNAKNIDQMITKTGVEDVDIIGCKGGDYTPSEILPKNHLLNYLPDLLKEYDFIFMESAPLNGFTDTKELVQYADGVIAIFSATAEVKQADKESIKYLHQLHGKFLGAILNKVGKSNINL